ncbi:MAG: ethanolamine ammonia-lyase reactivating factor EutA [Lachnospiraceae bacterium]|nr:ethanolamine ammonia-lyase reactivating factor EutA [Lachnospiraceae bacterium]
MKEEITSIGIDIGTSTTQLVFSSFLVENLASDYAVPRFSIVDKQIIYESDIIFTPLLSRTEIDIKALKLFIQSEYKKAGIEKDHVKTGAIIITGETARKENADIVLKTLSGFAGEFVVATAGPDLESVLSGYGSNANQLSKDAKTSIVNIDIGGGTSNLSYFDHGLLKGVACLDIGGHLVKVDSGQVTYIYPKLQELARKYDILIKEGDTIKMHMLRDLCKLMTKVLAASIHIIPSLDGFESMYTNDGNPLSPDLNPIGITFSGGVGDCIYRENDTNPFEYMDIGVILGQEIKNSPLFRKLEWFSPKETLRATVIGAGMHTTEISGSTISYSKEYLPLKNIPVIYIESQEIEDMQSVLKDKLATYWSEQSMPVAIAFHGKGLTSFKSIQYLADALIKGGERIILSDFPLIVITEEDIAKALGNALNSILSNNKPIVCIDSIHITTGTYIDIGKPIVEGQVLPVVIKTLIFNR